MSVFSVLDASVPEDRARWCEHWAATRDREVSAHPDYVGLFARSVDRVRCAAWQGAAGSVLYPFIQRPIAAEPWGASSEGCDLTTPYGYGGPFATGQPDAPAFWTAFESWASGERVISSFARLSLFPEQLLTFAGEISERGPNVVRSLDLDEDQLWMDYEHKVRKNVKKAIRAGLTVEFDLAGDRLEDFMDVYETTMDRRAANDAYYFGREFFESIVRGLAGQFVFCHVCLGGRVVSTELVLVSACHLYSFLGGTREEVFALRANDLLKHAVIGWGRAQGKSHYVLGGGYEPGDGIFRYKLAFAPRGEIAFRVGTRIHDAVAYDQLVSRRREWEAARGNDWHPTAGYFPLYRAGR